MMNSLLKRTLSGIIFAAILILAITAYDWSFYGIWILVGLLSLIEYWGLLRNHKNVFGSRQLMAYILGSLYIMIPIGMIMSIDHIMVLTFITIVWANDTGAYIVGSTIGKHQMSPKISPKKSWEGFVGGLLFAISTSLIWWVLYWSNNNIDGIQIFTREAFDDTYTKLLWLLFGLLIGVSAVLGDLVESKFKRTLGVKDSGSIIPGHGGMLDRFDATLLATPIVWLYVVVLGLI